MGQSWLDPRGQRASPGSSFLQDTAPPPDPLTVSPLGPAMPG